MSPIILRIVNPQRKTQTVILSMKALSPTLKFTVYIDSAVFHF